MFDEPRKRKPRLNLVLPDLPDMPVLSGTNLGPRRAEMIQDYFNSTAAYYDDKAVLKGLDEICVMTTKWILPNKSHYSPFWNERHVEIPGQIVDPDLLKAKTCAFRKWNNRSNFHKKVFANALTHMIVLMDVEGVSQEGLAREQDPVIFKTANEAMFMDLEHARMIGDPVMPEKVIKAKKHIFRGSLSDIYARFMSRRTRVDRDIHTMEFIRSETLDDKSSIQLFRDVTLLPAAGLGLMTVTFSNGSYNIKTGPVLRKTVEGPVEAFLQQLDDL